MPPPKECNKIKDPAKRKRCLSYAGEYAKKKKKSNQTGVKPSGSPNRRQHGDY
jgi:hypothetical protein|tara:strand:- start:328 stop:486 length:159 start_codon:yes stop_codon:yes gene_type:complete